MKRTVLIRRRSRPRAKRRGKLAGLARKADALWAEVVKQPGRCEVCRSSDRLQAAHGFSRRYRQTRWLAINGFCLCSACHMRYTYNPLAWEDYLKEAWGTLVYDELKSLALRVGKVDLGKAIADLEAEP